jgi:CRP-like cAMP-binding protein
MQDPIIPVDAAGRPLACSTEAASLCEAVGRIPHVVRRRFAAQAAVDLPASPALTLFVAEGAIARCLDREGDLVIVEVHGPGSWFSNLETEDPRAKGRWTLIALAPTLVLQMSTPAFHAACCSSRAASEAALDAERRRQSALLARMACLQDRSPVRRVACTLLYLGDALGQPCDLGGGIRVALPQRLIAAAVDLARQTTNRELRRLNHSRILHVERGVVCIVDRELLLEVAAGRIRPVPAPRPAACKLLNPQMALDCAPVQLRRA